jgi:hypothetical protein
MNHKIKIPLLLACVVILLVLPTTAFAKGLQDDRVVAGGTFTLESGKVLDGSLIVFGGSVTIESEAIVEGDVVVIGGTASINGLVEGNVLGIGGVIDLSNRAVVEGDLSTLGATLNRDPDSIVEGQIITGVSLPNLILVPTDISLPGIPDFRPVIRPVFDPIWRGSWFLLRSLVWAVLAVLIVMFLPNPTDRIARTAAKQPALSSGVGCLTVLVAPIILVVLAITLILIPVSLVGALIVVVAWFIGRIAIGLEIGRRLGKLFDKEWALPLAAGAGTFFMSLIVDGIGTFVPCVGWILPAIVGMLALGAVILSRFGSQTYPPEVFGSLVEVRQTGSLPRVEPGAGEDAQHHPD